jgi:hypothetical protein
MFVATLALRVAARPALSSREVEVVAASPQRAAKGCA